MTIDLEDDVPTPSPAQPPVHPLLSEIEAAKPGGRAFLISGIVSAALGYAGIEVGIVFSIRWNRHYDEVASLINKANQAEQDGNRALYDKYVEEYKAAREDLEENLRPADKVCMVAGYLTGGVLTLTGAALLMVYGPGKLKERPVAVVPSLGGMRFSF